MLDHLLQKTTNNTELETTTNMLSVNSKFNNPYALENDRQSNYVSYKDQRFGNEYWAGKENPAQSKPNRQQMNESGRFGVSQP